MTKVSELVGAWSLVSFRDASGVLPYGETPVGVLIFTETHCATILGSPGTRLRADDLSSGIAYFGKYEIIGALTRIAVSFSSMGFGGIDIERSYFIDGDELVGKFDSLEARFRRAG